ncbi:uncharacterized protein GLRG_04755 [Colletotrichum graminicola M1.001]|uniref:Uncharacterized protein n=1 Tax=Colletotrichum graminicola (strain M1.001 / M2 / FGSC 10212) TaxID=645133 RepID=E3QFH3_COLGM|nr:uncharacterized protein GLRG_04755 [Colletotrichum graminicola M1.001]EFQ29611.1 hypothetical protein GLRG_04755 [Colletotrichum graminicola M1.001]
MALTGAGSGTGLDRQIVKIHNNLSHPCFPAPPPYYRGREPLSTTHIIMIFRRRKPPTPGPSRTWPVQTFLGRRRPLRGWLWWALSSRSVMGRADARTTRDRTAMMNSGSILPTSYDFPVYRDM